MTKTPKKKIAKPKKETPVDQDKVKDVVKKSKAGIPKFKVQCWLCPEQVMSLERHMVLAHANVKRFRCRFCGKCVNERIRMKEHLGKIHGIGEELRCEHCPFATKAKDAMTRHMKVKHGVWVARKIKKRPESEVVATDPILS